MLADPCADPGIFARGVQARLPENSSDNVFFSFLSSTFTVLQWLIDGLFQRKLQFYKVSGMGKGVQHFSGGSNLFQGWGVQMLILETHRTCDFPGGVANPLSPSPLDPRM